MVGLLVLALCLGFVLGAVAVAVWAAFGSDEVCEKCEGRAADAQFSEAGRTVFGYEALCLSCMAEIERSMRRAVRVDVGGRPLA